MKIFVKRKELVRLGQTINPKDANPLVASVSMGNMLDYLPDSFYRLSRSAVINLNYLSRIEANEVSMDEIAEPLHVPQGGHQLLLKRLKTVRSRNRR